MRAWSRPYTNHHANLAPESSIFPANHAPPHLVGQAILQFFNVAIDLLVQVVNAIIQTVESLHQEVYFFIDRRALSQKHEPTGTCFASNNAPIL